MMKTTKKNLLLLTASLSVTSLGLLKIPSPNFTNLSIYPVNAQPRGLYLAPIKKNPRHSQGSGSRGCDQNLLTPMDVVKLVIPSSEYAAQTIAGRPTFYYYVSQAIPVPMEFALVKLGEAEPIMVQTLEAKQPGMVKVTMPTNIAELKTGQTYKWSISLVCNSKRPSANPLFYSWVERVTPSNDLNRQLLGADPYTQAKIYGQAGLWYDSFSAMEQAKANLPQDPSIATDYNSLVQQAGVSLE